MEKYTAVYEMGANGWVAAHIKEHPSVQMVGRGVPEARLRLHEALALYLDVGESEFSLVDEVR